MQFSTTYIKSYGGFRINLGHVQIILALVYTVIMDIHHDYIGSMYKQDVENDHPSSFYCLCLSLLKIKYKRRFFLAVFQTQLNQFSSINAFGA